MEFISKYLSCRIKIHSKYADETTEFIDTQIADRFGSDFGMGSKVQYSQVGERFDCWCDSWLDCYAPKFGLRNSSWIRTAGTYVRYNKLKVVKLFVALIFLKNS